MPPASIKLQEILMVSSHRIPTIAISGIFIAMRRKWTKKATKNDIERRACSHKSDNPHTNASMHFFL